MMTTDFAFINRDCNFVFRYRYSYGSAVILGTLEGSGRKQLSWDCGIGRKSLFQKIIKTIARSRKILRAFHLPERFHFWGNWNIWIKKALIIHDYEGFQRRERESHPILKYSTNQYSKEARVYELMNYSLFLNCLRNANLIAKIY